VASTVWDILRAVVFVGLLLAGAEWVFAWRRGKRTIRDTHGRLKPAVALALVLGALFAVAAVASLASDVLSS
jgi:hypothetical protein